MLWVGRKPSKGQTNRFGTSKSAPVSIGMAADTIKVHFASSDGGYTAEVKVSTDWEAFKQEVEDEFRRSQQIEIPGNFVLCNLSGSEVGSEIITPGVKLPAELRIKGNTKGKVWFEAVHACFHDLNGTNYNLALAWTAVSKIFVPVQNKGQMEILAGKIECINAVEELSGEAFPIRVASSDTLVQAST